MVLADDNFCSNVSISLLRFDLSCVSFDFAVSPSLTRSSSAEIYKGMTKHLKFEKFMIDSITLNEKQNFHSNL